MSTILVVSAHPDDETLFCGGTIAMHALGGHDVYILYTTRGEGGEVGDPPLTTKENLGKVREQESRNAGKVLGAKEVFFLPFTDPHMEIGGIAQTIDVSLETFSKAVSDYLERLNPDLVFTHGSNGEYGHPQHVYTHQAVLKAVKDLKMDSALLSWQAWQENSNYKRVLNRDDPADVIKDITPWKSYKIQAAMCYKTQHAMFLRNSGAEKVEDIVWEIESFHLWKGSLPESLN